MKNINKVLSLIFVTIAVFPCILAYYLFVEQSTDYYTKIDNSKISELPVTNSMKYEYSLLSYNNEGNSKEIKFKTERILKEGAYLKLDYMITRGVINWEEVTYDELPEKVKEKYNE